MGFTGIVWSSRCYVSSREADGLVCSRCIRVGSQSVGIPRHFLVRCIFISRTERIMWRNKLSDGLIFSRLAAKRTKVLAVLDRPAKSDHKGKQALRQFWQRSFQRNVELRHAGSLSWAFCGQACLVFPDFPFQPVAKKDKEKKTKMNFLFWSSSRQKN